MYASSRNDETTVLLAEKVHAFHKFFYVDYKENPRGRFLKITEKDGRFRSTIIIPEEAVDDLAKLLTSISQQYDPAGRTADKRKEIEEKRKEFEARRAERLAEKEKVDNDDLTSSISDFLPNNTDNNSDSSESTTF